LRYEPSHKAPCYSINTESELLWVERRYKQLAVVLHWIVTSLVSLLCCSLGHVTQQLCTVLVLKTWVHSNTALRTLNLSFCCSSTLPCNLFSFSSSSIFLFPPPPLHPLHPLLRSNLLSPSLCYYLLLCSYMFPVFVTVEICSESNVHVICYFTTMFYSQIDHI
jgi:hypothetical protein